jgi:hypothetical protein
MVAFTYLLGLFKNEENLWAINMTLNSNNGTNERSIDGLI